MSKESKIRFYALIDGQERGLFSIKQSGNSGLTITSRTPKLFGNSYEFQSEFDHQHYSVHSSNEGRDTTLTQKTHLVGGSDHSNVVFLKDTKEYLLWPVFARWLPALRSPISLLKRRSGDTCVKLAEFDSSKSILMYSVFICRPSFDVSQLNRENVWFEDMTIGNYRVIAIPMYMHVPSMDDGGVTGITTSPTVIDGKRSDKHFQLNPKPIPPDKILNYHNLLLEVLRQKYIYTLHQYLLKENTSFDLDLAMLEFTQKPPMF